MSMRTSNLHSQGRWIATVVVAIGTALSAIPALEALASSDPGHAVGNARPELLDSADSLGALFRGPPMVPGEARAACALIENQGEAAGLVRLYGRTAGDGLDAFLGLTVTRGTMPRGGRHSCSDFRPDHVDHAGTGSGVLYQGTLRAFPGDAGSALVDPGPAWAPGEGHAYRFVVRLADDAPQGLTVRHSFVWEAAAP